MIKILTLIDIQSEIWSRGQDWWGAGNDWIDFPLVRSGGNLRGFDEFNNAVYQSVDFTLRVAEGWRIVLANYPHECRFSGNLYSNHPDGSIFDNTRLSEIAIARLTGASDLLTYTQYVDTGSGLTPEQDNKLMGLPDLTDIWNYDEMSDKINMLFQIEVGDWEINNNQMIFYDAARIELLRFNLRNKAGQPSDTEVFSRRKI